MQFVQAVEPGSLQGALLPVAQAGFAQASRASKNGWAAALSAAMHAGTQLAVLPAEHP
jgi:hypothetical protein